VVARGVWRNLRETRAVTLTAVSGATVGYGDFSARTNLGHSLSTTRRYLARFTSSQSSPRTVGHLIPLAQQTP
jgi:hypothetical protein